MAEERTSRKRDAFSDKIHFKLLVRATVAGSIIGKGGEVIKKVQAENEVVIGITKDSFPGTPCRVCTIKGGKEGIKGACLFIMHEIGDKMEGVMKENEFRFLVPQPALGLIIGKQGSTINEITEKSGNANIDIEKKSTSSLPERIISISGSKEQVEAAFCLIYDHIIDDPKSQAVPFTDYGNYNIGDDDAGYSGGSGRGMERSARGMGAASMGMGMSMRMPNRAEEQLKSLLRGQGFEYEEAEEVGLAMTTLANYGIIGANANPNMPIDQLALFYGGLGPGASQMGGMGGPGKTGFWGDGDSDNEMEEGESEQVPVQEKLVGLIIGPRGVHRKELEDLCGITVSISKKGEYFPGTTDQRVVTLSGPPDGVKKAKVLIQKRVKKDQRRAKVAGMVNRGMGGMGMHQQVDNGSGYGQF